MGEVLLEIRNLTSFRYPAATRRSTISTTEYSNTPYSTEATGLRHRYITTTRTIRAIPARVCTTPRPRIRRPPA
jgi:hypothetical protein